MDRTPPKRKPSPAGRGTSIVKKYLTPSPKQPAPPLAPLPEKIVVETAHPHQSVSTTFKKVDSPVVVREILGEDSQHLGPPLATEQTYREVQTEIIQPLAIKSRDVTGSQQQRDVMQRSMQKRRELIDYLKVIKSTVAAYTKSLEVTIAQRVLIVLNRGTELILLYLEHLITVTDLAFVNDCLTDMVACTLKFIKGINLVKDKPNNRLTVKVMFTLWEQRVCHPILIQKYGRPAFPDKTSGILTSSDKEFPFTALLKQLEYIDVTTESLQLDELLESDEQVDPSELLQESYIGSGSDIDLEEDQDPALLGMSRIGTTRTPYSVKTPSFKKGLSSIIATGPVPLGDRKILHDITVSDIQSRERVDPLPGDSRNILTAGQPGRAEYDIKKISSKPPVSDPQGGKPGALETMNRLLAEILDEIRKLGESQSVLMSKIDRCAETVQSNTAHISGIIKKIRADQGERTPPPTTSLFVPSVPLEESQVRSVQPSTVSSRSSRSTRGSLNARNAL